MKDKAMAIMENMSNTELEEALERFGKDVSVNFLTRGAVESGIEKELDGYSDEEIKIFLDKYFK